MSRSENTRIVDVLVLMEHHCPKCKMANQSGHPDALIGTEVHVMCRFCENAYKINVGDPYIMSEMEISDVDRLMGEVKKMLQEKVGKNRYK